MLEQLLNEGWDYHDTESERLARELEQAALAPVPAGLLASFVALATHTIGQHLQDWPRALALGQRVLKESPAGENAAKACETLFVAAILAGDAVGAAGLELTALRDADIPLIPILSMRLRLADALAGAGRVTEAARVFHAAVDAADRAETLPALDRALASTSNNLAWTLHDLPARTDDEDRLMREAAAASLIAWRRCGNWINEELALALGASVACAAGDVEAALAVASEGLAVIAANGARPLDAARLHLVRARAYALRGDAAAHAQALAEADAMAQSIASAELKQQYGGERAEAVMG